MRSVYLHLQRARTYRSVRVKGTLRRRRRLAHLSLSRVRAQRQ